MTNEPMILIPVSDLREFLAALEREQLDLHDMLGTYVIDENPMLRNLDDVEEYEAVKAIEDELLALLKKYEFIRP